MEELKEEFEFFSNNVSYIARVFYYEIEFNKQYLLSFTLDPEGYTLHQSIQKNARFWSYHRYAFICSMIIKLGCVFDETSGSHSLKRLSNEVKKNAGFLNFDQQDLLKYKTYVDALKKSWNNDFKDLRRKIFAHQEVIDISQKKEILKKVDKIKLEKMIRRLFVVKSAVHNSVNYQDKPNCSYKSNKFEDEAKREIETLFNEIISKTPTS